VLTLRLSASLEGRTDEVIHQHIEKRLMKVALVDYKQHIEDEIQALTTLSNRERRLPTHKEGLLYKIKQCALVAVTTVLMELKQKQYNKLEEKKDVDWLHNLLNPNEMSNNASPMIGLIEIAWRGQVERICFPLPLEVKYLPSATKQTFLNEVIFTSAEKRMSSLFKKSDFFIAGACFFLQNKCYKSMI
jgi:hypothetical protein